ncbi:sugar ABC transporter substrate-binding protein [Pseudofrankia inefficax]|uniref:ABC-type sugar transport system periplasmic component-like protein n=1 Tax=Pseudofrankia inefficax (strain DSM 45817 / CECT 9037 / DDB 130130 / EuI1c) TaxID=298654 RepID=E3J941_PSEI1|nr:substrate-binding domain-containing protein [Pseudofrankia inefficax]ADP80920.1 ABC-type sugar transport system periplasmic component-like protein [Pseudofrankia inefficax]
MAALLALVSACGSSSGGATASSGGPSAAPAASSLAGSGSSAIAGVPTLDELFKGLTSPPPTTGPAPTKGKNVWLVSCGQAIPGCSKLAAAVQQAAADLGWNFHIADGMLGANDGFNVAMRTAIAAKPDAIIDESIDCALIEQSLKEAKAAGIPVIAGQANDCADAPLFAGPSKFSTSAPAVKDFFGSWGEAGAAYIINKTGGKAKIIMSYVGNVVGKDINEGFQTTISKCSGCQVVGNFTIQATETTPGGPFGQQLQAMLTKYPDANVVYLPYDSQLTNGGGAQIVKQSGRDILLVGGQGTAPAIADLVRSGQLSAMTSVVSQLWLGYATADNVNRVLSGQPTVAEGVGVVTVDKDHGLPADGVPAATSFDVKATYNKLWGVG